MSILSHTPRRFQSLLCLLLSTFLGVSEIPANEVPGELVENGKFRQTKGGETLGWTREGSVEMAPIPGRWDGAPAEALRIDDAGGVTQTLRGLSEVQTYRLRFRAWRRGGGGNALLAVTIAGVPLELSQKPVPSAAGAAGVDEVEILIIDTLVRPGSGEFPLQVAVTGRTAPWGTKPQVWLDEISVVPVEQSVPLLTFPLEATPFLGRSVLRAGREEEVGLQLSNPSEQSLTARVRLTVPPGVEIIGEAEKTASHWARRSIYCWFLTAYGIPRSVPEKNRSVTLHWKIRAAKPGDYPLQFEVDGERIAKVTVQVPSQFDQPLPAEIVQGEIPSPKSVATGELKIGANFYPGWVPGTGWGWSVLDPYPNRKPALGYYDDSEPEVMDWQIKWAVEHGIDFFNVCWFRERGNEGKPVVGWRSDTLDKGLLKAKFLEQIEFAITWENQNAAGVSSREDLLENVLPFWIENYFKNPSYLKLDGKPVLYIYSVVNLIQQLGGIEQTASVLEEMRAQTSRAGLSGLIVLGEYRGDDIPSQERIRASGYDGMWAYGIEDVSLLSKRKEAAILPDTATISVGWDPRPWQDYMGYWWTPNWLHSPEEFREVAEKTKAIVEGYPDDSLGRRLLLLDNWNEWGEGHWLAPSRQGGFHYLEAIRQTFAPASKKPLNLLPEDVGLGPYEDAYHRWIDSQKKALQKGN